MKSSKPLLRAALCRLNSAAPRRTLGTLALLFASSMAIGAPPPPAAPAAPATPSTPSAIKPLRIGVNCPFTGSSADMGVSMRAAVRIIAREINAVGGILGQPIELIERDDQANPEVGKRIADELIGAGVLLTIGYCNSGVALASIDTYQKARIPLLIPVATATAITRKHIDGKDGPSYIFRTAVPDNQQVSFMVDEILQRGWDKVALLADNTGYGAGGVEDLQAELARRSLKPVAVERFNLGETNMRPMLERARAAGANVVFAYTIGPENAHISKARAELKWAVPHVGPWTVGFGNHLSLAGANAEGALAAQTFIQESPHNIDRQRFIRTVTKELGQASIPCAMCAAQTYDAMQIVVRAAAQARAKRQVLTSAAIRDELENFNRYVSGIVTTYERPFSKQDHDAITKNMLVLGVVRQGVVRHARSDDELRAMTPARKVQGK